MKPFTVYPITVPTSLGQLKTINFYLVSIEDTFLLIDAGENNDACWHALQHTLKEAGITLEALEAILLTHNHTDHTGLIPRIQAELPIPVYAPEKAIPRLQREPVFFEKRYLFYRDIFQKMGCLEDARDRLETIKKASLTKREPMVSGPLIAFQPGDSIYHLTSLAVPGHSPDHVVFYSEAREVAFVGDHFLAHSPSNAIFDMDNDGRTFHSLLHYEQSLEKMLQLPMQTAYAGHGEVMHNPIQIVHDKLERLQTKANKIMTKLTEPKTAAMIAKDLYKERYKHPQLFPLIMSEVYGHLDRLTMKDIIQQKEINNVYYFYKRERGYSLCESG